MTNNRSSLFLQTIAGYLALTLLAPNSVCDRGGQHLAAGNGAASNSRSHALRPMGVEDGQTLQKIRAGLEENTAVPTVARVPFGDWEQSINRWLSENGVLEKETKHFGEGEFWTQLFFLNERTPLVQLYVDEDWAIRQPAMRRQLPVSGSTARKMFGRPLVQLVVNRYRRDDGREVLLIERVQILRGPQRLRYGEELETRAELVELMGRWGKENNIPVYLIHPEVMRDVNPELREVTIRRNYYEPVDQRNPRLWETVGLRVIDSAFLGGEDSQTDNWFLYRGNDTGAEAAGLEEPDQGIFRNRRDFLVQALGGGASAAQALSRLPDDSTSWGITVEELRDVLVPLDSAYSRLRGNGFRVLNQGSFGELRGLRERASGILSRTNIHPDITQWFSEAARDFNAGLDQQVQLEKQEASVLKVNAQRMELELTHPEQADLWAGVERVMRYAVDWGRPFSGRTLRFGYSGQTISSVFSEAQGLGIQSGQEYLVYARTHKLLPVLEEEWASVEENLKRRGVVVKPRLGVDRFLEELDRWMADPAAKVSSGVGTGNIGLYMEIAENQLLDEALAPLIEQFKARLVQTFGQAAANGMPDYSWPDWAWIKSRGEEATVKEIFRQRSTDIWNRVREPLLQELKRMVVQRLREERRLGRQITDEEIGAVTARISKLPDKVLNPQKAPRIAQALMRPYVTRPVSNVRAPDGIQGLAASVARDAFLRPLDLWVHVNLDGTLYDLYWVPLGGGRDAAIRIFSRVELDALQESDWQKAVSSPGSSRFLRAALIPGMRYRFQIPLGMGPEAIALQLWRPDWREKRTASSTGNVVEVPWPLGLPGPSPEASAVVKPEAAGLEEGSVGVNALRYPDVEAEARSAGLRSY